MKKITIVLIDGVNPELSYYVLEHCKVSLENNLRFQMISPILFTFRQPQLERFSITASNLYNPIEIVLINKLSWEDYNDFCLYRLNSYIKTDYVLIIQTDGFVVNPSAWTDEFLEYDYVGAPWNRELVERYDKTLTRLDEESRDEVLTKGMLCGNGGFSLRSKRLLELSTKLTEKDVSNEDVVICNTNRKYLVGQGIKFSSVEVGFKFSVEHTLESGIYEAGLYNGSFGFHGKGIPNLPILPHQIVEGVR